MNYLAPFYETIYIMVVLLYTLVYTNKRIIVTRKESFTPSFVLCVVVILFIGMRPIHPIFADMVGYAYSYQNKLGGAVFEWSTTGSVLFDYISALLSAMNVPINLYFIIISALYFIPMLMACRKLFPQATMLTFLVCLGAFSTFSYGVNGIRAGIAASIFLLALAYREKKICLVLLMFISWGFHHSMNMPIAAFVLTLFIRNSKSYLFAWLACLALSLAHVTYFQELFAGITDEKGAIYLNGNSGWDGWSGFRYDFVIYSIVPIIIGYMTKYKYKLENYFYDNILNMYLITNGIWLLSMYAGFTNRIAYLSWFLYPILIIYPFVLLGDENRAFTLKKNRVVWGHLFFTIFMMIYTAIR